MKRKSYKVYKTAVRVIAMIAASLLVACMLTMLAGCAPAENDTPENQTVDKVSDPKTEYAIVRLPDGTIIQGTMDHRYMYESGCIKITIDGVVYYTHFANVAIIESTK